ncbi:MAG: hypothetical protein JW797_09765 [Bradymonadales bacterium]|nr:hypothetical protein [Bradymonadales bacterium]
MLCWAVGGGGGSGCGSDPAPGDLDLPAEDGQGQEIEDARQEEGDQTAADWEGEDAPDRSDWPEPEDTAGEVDDPASDQAGDLDGSDHPDGYSPAVEFAIGLPFPERPADPLAGSALESCPVYQDERCEGGQLHRCQLYDTSTEQFVDSPDPLLHRVLLFERWYEGYQAPDGQTCDRYFTQAMDPGTPEEIWGDPARFSRYGGAGDAAIWTGVALNAFILRYLNTGTRADYLRMEQKVRQLLTLFEVTSIPGYLARHHYLLMDPAGPGSHRHIVYFGQEITDPRDHPIDQPAAIDGLPDAYLTGILDAEGRLWTGTPAWHGNPSIDQYTGPMVTFPAAWGLLEDENLRERIAHHMTCYLKRLRRIEIINLQSNPDLRELFQEYFAGGHLQLEPDDFDFSSLDTLVGYVLLSYNRTNAQEYDRSCPDSIQLEPYRIIDAAGSTAELLAQVMELALDLQSGETARSGSIDHFYVPSVRGGDAVHLMHLAAMAYAFTGDPMYRDFLRDELIGALHTVEIAHTMGALVEPHWCRSFYGNHITFSPLWAFINLLDESPLRTEMQLAMHQESWSKLNHNLENAKFNLMYAGVVPPNIATARSEAVVTAILALQQLGGNGPFLDDPRRHYSQPRETVIEALPEGFDLVCPTESQRVLCEQGPTLYGIQIPLDPITHTCRGEAGECLMEDGLCTWAMSSRALPIPLRRFESFLWQRNPFALGNPTDSPGTEQVPGLDLIELYWLARTYGFVTEGQGQVLAWHPIGSCE